MSVLGNAKSDRHRKTHGVEPDGMGRKYMFLPGETLDVRAAKESAEAVVAMRLAERLAEQRAEESRKNHNSKSGAESGQAVEMHRALQQRQPPERQASWGRWNPEEADLWPTSFLSLRGRMPEGVQ